MPVKEFMPPLSTSIAVATYQGERFLAQQLDSFLSQTRLPDEVCISDDGSTDGTLGVVDAFRARAPFPVRVFSNPSRGGVNKNFEHAVSQCTADVILFSDQDDVWLPQHIERLVVPMERNPAIVAVASDSDFVDESLTRLGCTQSESDRFPAWLRDATMRLPKNQLELVLRQSIATGHGMAFRRSLLSLLVPFTTTFMYDEWVLILSAAAGCITYVPEPLTLHRQHQEQAAKTRNKDLKVWAAQSKNVSGEQERRQEAKWSELLERVRERSGFSPNFKAAEKVLRLKHDFVARRRLTRRRALPMRLVITLRELLLGRYHRMGRGFLTFARDLYGVRQ